MYFVYIIHMVPPKKSSQNLEAKMCVKHCKYQYFCRKHRFFGGGPPYIYIYMYIRKSCWEWHECKNSNIFLWNPWIPMKQHRLWQHEVQRSWRPRPGRTMFTAKYLGLVLGDWLKWSRWFTQKQPVDIRNTALQTNMTMEKQPFKDISSMKHCDFPILVYWMANDGNIIWYQQVLQNLVRYQVMIFLDAQFPLGMVVPSNFGFI